MLLHQSVLGFDASRRIRHAGLDPLSDRVAESNIVSAGAKLCSNFDDRTSVEKLDKRRVNIVAAPTIIAKIDQQVGSGFQFLAVCGDKILQRLISLLAEIGDAQP